MADAAATHEHQFHLQLGPGGRGQLFGRYEGYVRQCSCGEYAPDYRAFLDSFHECPDCGARHRRPVARQEGTLDG